MNLQLDHIVHFISQDPQAAVEQWEKHGIKAVMGGSHELWGTYNSLLYTASSYIEYLAIENQEIAQQSNNPLIQHLVKDLARGEGAGQICFRTDNIEDLKDTLEKKGYSTFPIFPGSRRRKDGTVIEWKMLFLKEEASVPYPFFIEWGQKDDERFKELKSLGMMDKKLANHTIQSISYAVKNCDQTAKLWSELLDFPIHDTYMEPSGASKKTVLKAGAANIVFCESSKSGIVKETIASRGERPFLIEFNPPISKNEITLYQTLYK